MVIKTLVTTTCTDLPTYLKKFSKYVFLLQKIIKDSLR